MRKNWLLQALAAMTFLMLPAQAQEDTNQQIQAPKTVLPPSSDPTKVMQEASSGTVECINKPANFWGTFFLGSFAARKTECNQTQNATIEVKDRSLTDRLLELSDAFNKGLLTAAEFAAGKAALLKTAGINPGGVSGSNNTIQNNRMSP